MKICIYGAGAIGGYLGAKLTEITNYPSTSGEVAKLYNDDEKRKLVKKKLALNDLSNAISENRKNVIPVLKSQME